MKRLLSVFLYYFTWQRTMTWVTIIGLAFVLGGLLPIPEAFAFLLIAIGVFFSIGFPVMFASVAFRQAIGNRRILMLPHFRFVAAAALLLVALAASAMMLAFAVNVPPGDVPSNLPAFVALVFSLISAYLLITQWLLLHPLGLAGIMVLPLVGVSVGLIESPVVVALARNPWPLTALALLCWAWLMLAMRSPRPPRGIATAGWASAFSPPIEANRGTYQWIPHRGPAASPAGTLMRGARDGWRNRVIAEFMFVLSFPLSAVVVFSLMFYITGLPFDTQQQRGFGVSFFLYWSFFGLMIQSSMTFAEWPARLRYIWLRVAGDRRVLWRYMERALIEEALLVGLVTSAVALTFLWLTPYPATYLLLYVGGCVIMSLLATYCGFWIRAKGWHRLVHGISIFSIAVLCLGAIPFLQGGGDRESTLWLLPILGVVAVGFRELARRSLWRIDWCAVRPVRLLRRILYAPSD